MTSPFEGKWEQRWHPLREEWVVYSAHRNSRPWDGASEDVSEMAPSYEKKCYLCPGNTRIHGDTNPAYQDVFIFDNDHPVVGENAPDVSSSKGLFQRQKAEGIARVVCYDPRHNVTLSDVPVENVAKVIQAWKDQTIELGSRDEINYVLIFENKGEIVGTSSPHPHCQIYATNFPFKNTDREIQACCQYRDKHNENLFAAILQKEQEDKERIIIENEHAIAVLPWFARYAYECWVYPQKRHATMATLSSEEIKGLASVYQELIQRYDALYKMSFPYVMSLYQAPLDGKEYDDYHLHFVFLPPLRQPGLKKFPAGPEIGGGNFMSDTLPEEKAAELRALRLEGA